MTLLVVHGGAAGCGRRGATDDTGGAAGARVADGGASLVGSPWSDASRADVAEARALADPRSTSALGDPMAAAALAERVEALGVREGAGGRAAELHELAARLFERLWRSVGEARDGERALALHRAAATAARTPVACDAAVRGARLAGDLARDAAVAYAELYRAKLRFPDASDAGAADGPRSWSGCARDIVRSLDQLAAFRPPDRALEAIAENLEAQGEGVPAIASAAAGATAAPPPPRVVRVDVWPGEEAARVVVRLDRPAPYRVSDERVGNGAAYATFVDLDGVDRGAAPPDAVEPGVVTRVATEAASTGSRVRIDLDGRAWRRVFYMEEPYRVVIDVARHPPGAVMRATRDVSRVVLDAGHGGKDTGAVGPAGTAEKDVTLDVARKAARVLSSQGIAVLLTREDDRFVSLEERTARANAFGADLFVSIHCNASESRAPRGIETYVLDTTRDEIAARVAARENETTQAASLDVAAMLSGMRLADQSDRSRRFARLLQRSAVASLRMQYGDVSDGGVHPAGFYVLVGARMPGVLFESSYISNPGEEQRLDRDDYRQSLADALANAIRAYREGR